MKPSIRIGADGCLFLALAILVLPMNWLLAAVAAALWHELCHLLAVYLTGGQVFGIFVDAGGIVMETGAMDDRQELLCSLAGPAGSLLLSLLLPVFPRLGLCSAVQGGFNLLPVYPLDGGRALCSGCRMVLKDPWPGRICEFARFAVVLGTVAAAVILSLRYDLGISPLFLAGVLAYRVCRGKIPCKESNLAVQ